MATTFPRFILFKFDMIGNTFFSYSSIHEGVRHCVTQEFIIGVHNPVAKIELEPAKIDSKYFHLRFYGVNRYWAVNSDGIVVAESKTAEEDASKSSCTLFEPTRVDDVGNIHLTHVHTNGRLVVRGKRLLVDKRGPYTLGKFKFVDWDTIVKLPEHVAFKGDNGKYLQAHRQDDEHYLKFSSDDPYDQKSGFHVELRQDGSVRIKSDYVGKFWRLSPSWIWADEDRLSSRDRKDDAFWPIKIDGNTIALRSAANNNYCTRLPDVDGKKDCLNAAVSTITRETRLVVEELVQERQIYEVIYRMEDQRIFDEVPYLAGKTVAYNKGDTEGSVGVEISYQDEKSYSFTRGFSITAGVKTNIKCGAPFIAEGGIEVSLEVTGSMEWGTTSTATQIVKATGTVPVPAKSKAVVHYVGTKGSCNVPYSYTQQDKSSTDGKIVYSKQNDGMYTGVSCYNFEFVMEKPRPI